MAGSPPDMARASESRASGSRVVDACSWVGVIAARLGCAPGFRLDEGMHIRTLVEMPISAPEVVEYCTLTAPSAELLASAT